MKLDRLIVQRHFDTPTLKVEQKLPTRLNTNSNYNSQTTVWITFLILRLIIAKTRPTNYAISEIVNI